jgi:hypothetical protein
MVCHLNRSSIKNWPHASGLEGGLKIDQTVTAYTLREPCSRAKASCCNGVGVVHSSGSQGLLAAAPTFLGHRGPVWEQRLDTLPRPALVGLLGAGFPLSLRGAVGQRNDGGPAGLPRILVVQPHRRQGLTPSTRLRCNPLFPS